MKINMSKTCIGVLVASSLGQFTYMAWTTQLGLATVLGVDRSLY